MRGRYQGRRYNDLAIEGYQYQTSPPRIKLDISLNPNRVVVEQVTKCFGNEDCSARMEHAMQRAAEKLYNRMVRNQERAEERAAERAAIKHDKRRKRRANPD